MGDIQKLHKVIDILEEQSTRVSEFNGLLSAVNSAKEEVTAVKNSFSELAEEQKKLVSGSYNRFEEYGKKFAALESKLLVLERTQQQTLSELSSLSFLTPEQFEQSRSATEKIFTDQITFHSSKVDNSIADQAQAIRSLRKIAVIGIIVLSCGIAWLSFM